MRLAVYTDYVYRRAGDTVLAERAFATFLSRLSGTLSELVIVGRLHSGGGPAHYRLPADVRFVGLPYYASAARPAAALRAMTRSLFRFWRVLDEVEGAWLLGPHPLAVAFAVLAVARRKRVFLGVRQDYLPYVRNRHPARPMVIGAALLLEGAFRLLAFGLPVIVVGPEIAAHYRGARRLLEISVSLVAEADVAGLDAVLGRTYGDELKLLSVGRLEPEKNPLLLADVLARLRRSDPRWRLIVCGEGPLGGELRARLETLGVEEHAELKGYMPIDGGLMQLYRSSHAFLHVSWTEGMPQVLLEAFAAGLPTVATAVGGVERMGGQAILTIPPGNPDAAVHQLRRLASESDLRGRMIEAGLAIARRHTTEAEISKLSDFLLEETRVSG